MQTQVSLSTTIISTLFIGLLCFGGGVLYQRSQSPRPIAGSFGNRMTSTGNNPMRQNGMGMRPLVGEIISSDESSVTLKLTDGSTKIVLISDSATILTATAASRTDLVVGKQLTVVGTQNSDGTMTAQSLSLGQFPLGTAGSASGSAQR